MPETSLGVAELKAGLLRAGEYLQHNYQILDNLNVFPVPDGDTGTNMLMTYQAGIDRLPETNSISDIGQAMNESLTRQSRGNSGFILARFFHGFFEVMGEVTAIGHQHIAEAFANGSYHVNTSLFTPVEGTMITIIAAMTDSLRGGLDGDVRSGLRVALDAARVSLFETPRLLKILAKAGVVDSGALGFLFLMEGFLRGVMNLEVVIEDERLYRFQPDPSAIADMEEAEQMHRYCTEILLQTSGSACADVREFLKKNGSSIALVQEANLLKVHIHTDDPDHVMAHLATMGTIENTKIEDMQEQMGLFAVQEDPESLNAILACVPGEGFRDLLASLGIDDAIVYTGELPTTAAILDALDASESRNITILPNNKNILPTAMLARDRSEKNVSILPTENVIQGFAALYGYSENATMQENIRNMADCMNMADSLFLYQSVSDTVFDRTEIPEGHYFCARGGHIIAVASDPRQAAMDAMGGLGLKERTNICLYHGTKEAEESARNLRDLLISDFPGLEVECLFGGQPREYLIISME